MSFDIATQAGTLHYRPFGEESLCADHRAGRSLTNILPFLKDRAFDSDTTRAMGEAFDRARKLLQDRGQPDVVQEVIASRIIDIALTGERDPDRMCKQALATLGIERID